MVSVKSVPRVGSKLMEVKVSAGQGLSRAENLSAFKQSLVLPFLIYAQRPEEEGVISEFGASARHSKPENNKEHTRKNYAARCSSREAHG